MRSMMRTAGFVVRVESVAADSSPESLIHDLCDFANLIGAMVSCDVNGKLVVVAAGADPVKVIETWRTSPPISFFGSGFRRPVDALPDPVLFPQQEHKDGDPQWPPRPASEARKGGKVSGKMPDHRWPITSSLQTGQRPPSPHSPEGRREIDYRRMQGFGLAVLGFTFALYFVAAILRILLMGWH